MKLHLGCGENYLEGYVNVDYPPSEHPVMKVRADIYCDVTELEYPPNSVDEIKSHHLFEHFDRATALGILARWSTWLKINGRLIIETPDFLGSIKSLMLDKMPWKIKMGIIRHLTGCQSADWGYHLDLWFGERFARVLKEYGFYQIEAEHRTSIGPPYLSNIIICARKKENLKSFRFLEVGDKILSESMVSPVEEPLHDIWRKKYRKIYFGKDFKKGEPEGLFKFSDSQIELNEIWDFNQRDRDYWIAQKALTVPSKSKVLDIGAGTCPYQKVFSHCDYKTHDFMEYKGIKLGGAKEYGKIDYVSDICNLRIPNETFDAVLCTEVLEHVPEPMNALREAYRILKPGGRLFLTAPLGCGLHQMPFHFYGGFTPEWYKYFAEKIGFKIIEITANGGFFKLMAQESQRLANIIESAHLEPEQFGTVWKLFSQWIPKYCFKIEKKINVESFTVGYHVEMEKI